MRSPRWCRWLLERIAGPDRAPEVVGDLEEAHMRRVEAAGRGRAYWGTVAETIDMARALLIERVRSTDTPFSLLDFKLGLRMLFRYPGLTVLGGLALAYAIAMGALTFEVAHQVMAPDLGVPEGDRLVGIQQWNTREGIREHRIGFEVGYWSERSNTLEKFGAMRYQPVNLLAPNRPLRSVQGSEIHAVAFEAMGVQATLGRTLQPLDERADAPPVVVIGHALWESLFEADPSVVGTEVQVGEQHATIVGVMPKGFGFPINHELWTPLKLDPTTLNPLEGPPLLVFGRIVEGGTLDDARTELANLSRSLSLSSPETHSDIVTVVDEHANTVFGIRAGMVEMFASLAFLGSNAAVFLFVALICGNVALLLFARSVAREAELAVRSALGASRGRIVGQLFAEALVLATVAAMVGLGAADFVLGEVFRIANYEMLDSTGVPFWMSAELSSTTIAYSVILVVVAAALSGFLPALKVTRGIQTQLQRRSAGAGGFRFGGVWTAVIVLQIALTVVFPVFTIEMIDEVQSHASEPVAIETGDYLSGRVRISMDLVAATGDLTVEGRERYSASLAAIRDRLESDPRITGVAYTERAPRTSHAWAKIAVDGPTAQPLIPERGHRVSRATVSPGFFSAMGVAARFGRDFAEADLDSDVRPVIVNESFVAVVMGGRNPVGARLRIEDDAAFREPGEEHGPWMEIIGVVPDLGAVSGYGQQAVYRLQRPENIRPLHFVAHIPGAAAEMGGDVRQAAFEVDPLLRFTDLLTLDETSQTETDVTRFVLGTLIFITGLAILLSMAGIYSIMSFTVAQRTREIGVRIALGSGHLRVVREVLRRPVRQVGTGIAVGALFLVGMVVILSDHLDWSDFLTIGKYVAMIGIVCVVACVSPTRKALAVHPSEALRAEG